MNKKEHIKYWVDTAIDDWSLEGRYPDYFEKMNRAYRAKNSKEILDKINSLRKCLLKELQ